MSESQSNIGKASRAKKNSSPYRVYRREYADRHKDVARIAAEFRAAGQQRMLTVLLADIYADIEEILQRERLGGLVPNGVTTEARSATRTFVGLSDSIHLLKATTQNQKDVEERKFSAEFIIGTARLEQAIHVLELSVSKRLKALFIAAPFYKEHESPALKLDTKN